MRHLGTTAIFLCALVSTVSAQEQPKNDISSLALFRNGLAVVSRSLAVDKPGVYVVDAPMRPVYGSFWIAQGQDVSVSGETRKLEVPNGNPFSSLQDSLLGHEVVLHLLSGDKETAVKGKVVDISPEKTLKNWSRDYNVQNRWGNNRELPFDPYVALKDEKGGITLLRQGQVSRVETDSLNQTVKVEKPVFLFNVKDKPKGGAVFYSYITKGIAWAPEYRLRLEGSTKMNITLAASIRNELEDFKDTSVSLVYGYPNIAEANVTSLLCADTTLAKFLQGDSNHPVPNFAMQRLYAGKAKMEEADGAMPDIANTTGDSCDIVLIPAGKMSLKEGGSTWFVVATETADYERLVECIVKDRRDLYGRINGRENDGDPNADADLWDSLRFKNPFKFPMAAAPVEISDASSFLGQCKCSNVNKGEEALLRVTKALSITATNTEQEIDKQRITVYVAERPYQKTSMKGVLTLKSFRQEAVKVTAKLQFSGDLLAAEGNPECKLRKDGLYSVNKRNALSWDVVLKPGEELSLSYSYSVLILR